MKTLLLSLSFLFSICLAAQDLPKQWQHSKQLTGIGGINESQHTSKILGRSEPFRLDSFNVWMWDAGQERWELNIRNQYTYNAQGLQEVLNTLVYQNGDWDNISRDSLFYDDEGRLILTGSYGWDGNAWMAFSLFFQSYGQQTAQAILQVWTGFDWFNQFKLDYVYDANGLILSDTFSTWGGSDWEVVSKSVYSYNAQNLIDTAFYQDLEQGVWEDAGRVIYTYDGQGRQLTFLRQEYISGEWENVYRETSSYNNGIRTTIGEEWVLNQWEILSKSDFLVVDDRIIYITNSSWDGLDWIKSDSVYYYYSDLSAIDKPVHENNLVNAYPNPVKDLLIIESEGILATNAIVEIVSSTGERVYRNKNFPTNKHEIEVSQLAPGLYFAVINSGIQRETVRFMKL